MKLKELITQLQKLEAEFGSEEVIVAIGTANAFEVKAVYLSEVFNEVTIEAE